MGGSLARTPQNVVNFVWPVTTCKMMHQICYGFYWSIKKWLKWGQKSYFLAHFERFFLVHFGTQFTARKPKIFLKTRISVNTTYRSASLGILNDVSIRSQKNHIIHVKLSKRKFWDGGKLGLNCPLVPLLKVIINSHLAYHTTINYLLFMALPKINNHVLFFQDPIGPIWSGLWAIPLVKNARLNWYFDDR